MTALRAALVLSLLLPSAASAQEVIATGSTGSPPAGEASVAPARPVAAEDDRSPEAIGRWARGVLAGAPAEASMAQTPRRGCTPPADRRPHGEVRAGAGTGGYRELGAVITQPIGDCGRVTVAIDKVEMDAPRRRR